MNHAVDVQLKCKRIGTVEKFPISNPMCWSIEPNMCQYVCTFNST
uniref:Uncharacterized protein n=1 Tax=Anguilla anguilla TaxID=7936 RepID=A0A0E9RNV9_ANGAN